MRPRKFDDVAKALEGRILSGELKPGDLLPSQARLCELFSVSRSCAQKALEELNAKGLLESRPGKGVYVRGAKSAEPEKKRFKNVALVFHQEFRLEADPMDNFGLEMLWGVEEKLREFGANCIIRKRSRTEGFEKIVPELESIGADAFIMDREFSDEALRPLQALGAPVAVLGRLSALPFASCSLPNHADCFLQAMVQMADEGRGSVALVCEGLSYYDPDLKWAVERAAAMRPGCKFELLTLNCPLVRETGGLERVVDGLLKSGLPEVLIFSNDWSAVAALERLAKRGVSIPKDVSLVGCYGLQVGVKNKLSSMSVDAREIGRRAVEALAASALEGRRPSVERTPFFLVERDSFRWKQPR